MIGSSYIKEAQALHFRCIATSLQRLRHTYRQKENPTAARHFSICHACHTFRTSALTQDLLCLILIQTKEPFGLPIDADGLGVLGSAGINISFLCQGFQQSLAGEAKTFCGGSGQIDSAFPGRKGRYSSATGYSRTCTSGVCRPPLPSGTQRAYAGQAEVFGMVCCTAL